MDRWRKKRITLSREQKVARGRWIIFVQGRTFRSTATAAATSQKEWWSLDFDFWHAYSTPLLHLLELQEKI
jgi:hypothetical protein